MNRMTAQGMATIVLTALLLWLVPAHAAETCLETCGDAGLPGCSYTGECLDWGSGCETCMFECESSCELWICPGENPDLDCEDPV